LFIFLPPDKNVACLRRSPPKPRAKVFQNGVYTYTWGTQVMATLDTNTTPVTFYWHVEFDDNCTLRSYGSLTYFGVANN